MRWESPPSAEFEPAEAKAFLDFVDPEDDGGEGFGLGEGFAEAGLTFADEFLVEDAGVHAEERHAPGAGDNLGTEAFSAALDAEEEDSARRGETEFFCSLGEAATPLVEPFLEVGEASDVFGGDVGGEGFEAAGSAETVSLGVHDAAEVVDVEDIVVVDGSGDEASCFGGCQPAEHLDELVHLAVAEFDTDLCHSAIGGLAEGGLDDLFHFLFVGPADIVGYGEPERVGRQAMRVDKDKRPESGIGGEVEVAEGSGDSGVGAEWADVFEEVDDGVGGILDVSEGGHNGARLDQFAPGGGRSGDESFGDGPFGEGAIHLGRDIADDLDSPGFVGGLDGDDGVFCTDEEFEFVGGHFFRLEA